MRGTMWLMAPMFILASMAWGQQPPAKNEKPPESAEVKKQSLEELLATALQHSPEVQVAEAKLREAEAQLRATRLQIAQRLIDLHTSSETQHKNLSIAESEYKRMMKMREAGTVSLSEFAEVERKFQTLKGQIAQLEASVATLTGRLPALNRVEGNAGPLGAFLDAPLRGAINLGGLGGGGGLGSNAEAPKPRWPRQAMADKMLKALEQPVSKVEKMENIPLNELIEFVRQQNKDVPVLAKLAGQGDQMVNINFKGELTLGAYFQVLIDTIPDLKIFVRDYGFFITFAGSEPEEGLDVIEFLQKAQRK